MSETSEHMPDDHGTAHERLRGADKLLGHRVDSLGELVKQQRLDINSLHDRLSSIEKWQWLCYGISIGVTALAVYALKGLGLNP